MKTNLGKASFESIRFSTHAPTISQASEVANKPQHPDPKIQTVYKKDIERDALFVSIDDGRSRPRRAIGAPRNRFFLVASPGQRCHLPTGHS
jgi:hypothetical protein